MFTEESFSEVNVPQIVSWMSTYVPSPALRIPYCFE